MSGSMKESLILKLIIQLPYWKILYKYLDRSVKRLLLIGQM